MDIVIHSATKYLGGHNDLLAGVALGKHKMLDDLYKMQRMIGATPGPLTCFLLERGLKTFRAAHGTTQPLRPRHGAGVGDTSQSRKGLVSRLRIASRPQDRREQMRGFGSVITFLVKGGEKETRKFIDSLELFLITPSLGGSESLVTQMATMSFFDYPAELPPVHRHGGQPRPPGTRPGRPRRPYRRSLPSVRSDIVRS